MNMNVLKIDVLSATPAEPARDVSAHHPMGRAERLDRDDSQIALAGAESPSGSKRGEPDKTTTEAYQADTTQSYNIAPAVQKNNKESPNRDFENVLKRRLKQSDSEQNTEDVSPKTQNSGTDGKAEQGLTLTALQNGITVLVEQKPSVTPTASLCEAKRGGKTVSNQPSQSVQNASTHILNSASNETLVVVGGDLAAVTENQEQGVTRQAQATSDAAQNQVKATQAALLTPGQDAAVQQDDGQSKLAAAKESLSNADTGQTRGNTATVPQRVTDNSVKMNVPADGGGSGKPAEAANQGNSANTESVNLSGRQELVQSKAQSAVVSAGTTTELKDGKQVAESVAAGGRQAGLEAAYRGRVKDDSGHERQKDSNDLSNGSAKVETGTAGLNEKLNVEKVELSSGKNDTTKSEQGISAPQSARTQMFVFNAGQVTSDRPITADSANVAARSASANDTAAAIRDQIFQSVQTSIQQGQREITVHLNPPDLGRVSIKFSEQGKELTGLLETANPQTRAEIRQAIPEIIRSLEELGISIKRLDVTLSDSSGKSDLSRQSTQDSLRDNSSKDLWQQLGNQNFNDAGGNRSSYDSLVATGHFSGTPEFSGGILTEPNQSSHSDTLLDVLI
jgi:flagellar hook-length control protein FliK